MTVHICARCKGEFPLDEMYIQSGGRCVYCRECGKELKRGYYAKTIC